MPADTNDSRAIANQREIPGSPLKMNKRKRQSGGPQERAQAYEEFATHPKRYRSLAQFVIERCSTAKETDWIPSMSQMQRDMRPFSERIGR